MNREAAPLILAISIPIVIVILVVLSINGINILETLKVIPILYYIIIFPILLGLIAALFYLKKI
jgi:hypothetical protein